MKLKLLYSDSIIPTRGSSGAVGYDLYNHEPTTRLLPGERKVFKTGVSVALPPGTYGRVAPRSGMTVKYGVHVGAGVIDPDYTGEVGVVLFNLSDEQITIEKDMKIAQLILELCITPEIDVVDDLDETTRGSGGWGSTGYLNLLTEC